METGARTGPDVSNVSLRSRDTHCARNDHRSPRVRMTNASTITSCWSRRRGRSRGRALLRSGARAPPPSDAHLHRGQRADRPGQPHVREAFVEADKFGLSRKGEGTAIKLYPPRTPSGGVTTSPEPACFPNRRPSGTL